MDFLWEPGVCMDNNDLIKDSIWKSASETFATMIFLPIEKTDKTEIQSDATSSLICSITFTGPIQGVFSICCSVVTAEKIARAMLMSEPDDELAEADICDALGEVNNMVLGGIKTRIAEAFGEIQISIPSVIKGLEIQPAMGKDTSEQHVCAKADGELMKMTVVYKG
jgi:CheY-specific phosphatase CheX